MTARRAGLLAVVWLAPSIVFVAITAVVYGAYRIEPAPRIAMEPVFAALRGGPPVASPGPIAVTAWIDGRTAARVDGSDPSVIARDLQERLGERLARARLQVDRIIGHAPLGANHRLVRAFALPGLSDALAINPGIDGIGAQVGEKQVLVLPHELVASKLLSTNRPSDVLQDFAMGADLKKIATLLAMRGGQRTP